MEVVASKETLDKHNHGAAKYVNTIDTHVVGRSRLYLRRKELKSWEDEFVVLSAAALVFAI